MKTKYVVGLMFDVDCTEVLLIRKNKPKWQAGLLNGIGGKIEASDLSAINAMQREFKEEAGEDVWSWIPFCTMSGTNNDGSEFQVDFFHARGEYIDQLKSQESEKLEVHDVKWICGGQEKTIGNLPWIIAMAVDCIKGVHPPKMVTAQY
jgi:8-oxo-dGTP diphosphatase